MRIARYDRAGNEAHAVSALQLNQAPLEWFRLDDGVMGGRSSTEHSAETAAAATPGVLHFAGVINTDGGGFCSIRTRLAEHALSNAIAIKLRVRGDGKTYKFFLTDGSRAGPMARTPSWQMDVPTTVPHRDDDEWHDVVIPLDQLRPSFVGGTARASVADADSARVDAAAMQEMGVMLSLKLSDGSPNPVATFGLGVFPFSLRIQSIEAIQQQPSHPSS